jgi:hypothetical protein
MLFNKNGLSPPVLTALVAVIHDLSVAEMLNGRPSMTMWGNGGFQ